jgi:hypothetical protein
MKRSTFWKHVTVLAAAAATAPPAVRAAGLDQNYVLALECAESFLDAWRKRDAGGLAFVSASARKRSTDAAIRAWLVGTSSPSNAAFEIGAGRAVSPGHYRFMITLYYYLTGGGLDAPKAQSLDVVQAGGKWYVANLPA